MKRYMVWLMCMWAMSVSAQQFGIRSFRQLQHDITAWIDPVRDLNKEACALIKIPGGKNFAFTTPLGVVKRVEEVGETWLYVPHGTIQLTVKHPRWGVLRDYRLGQSLESRIVYELVLDLPLEQPLAESNPGLSGLESTAGELHTKLVVVEKKARPKEPLLKIAMLTADIGASQVAPGVRLGIARRHGVYLRAAANFVSSSADWECQDDGSLLDGSETPYYKDKKESAYYAFLIGGLHRLAKKWYLYEGIGYGSRQLLWETTEGVKVKNVDASYQGVAAEAGALYRCGRLVFSAGAATLKGKIWTFSLGAGLGF